MRHVGPYLSNSLEVSFDPSRVGKRREIKNGAIRVDLVIRAGAGRIRHDAWTNTRRKKKREEGEEEKGRTKKKTIGG